jgi:hypothetical protein
MSSFDDKGRFVNKSALIREVYEAAPTATNRWIRKEILDKHNVVVNDNLIISAIGRYKHRIRNANNRSSLAKQSKEFLKSFLGDVEQAVHFVKAAAR